MPLTASQALLDEFMAHEALLQRLIAAEADRVRLLVTEQIEGPVVDRVASTLSRFRSRGPDTIIDRFATLRDLDAAVRSRVTRGADALMARTLRVGEVIGLDEARFVRDAVAETWPFRLPKGRTVSPEGIRAILRSRPFQGKVLRDWVKDFDAATRRRIREQIQVGLLNGESTDAIVQRLVGVGRPRVGGVFPGTRRDAETIVRTAIQHVSSFAQRDMMLKHGKLFRFEVWTTAFDSRVCERCLALQGRRFEPGVGPYPGLHARCRCSRQPVFVSAKEAGFDPSDPLGRGRRPKVAVQYDDLGKATDGKAPLMLDGDAWLRAQPEWVQDQILGKGGAAIWRRGDVPAGAFIDRSARGLTLAELRAKEQAIREGRRVVVPRMAGEVR